MQTAEAHDAGDVVAIVSELVERLEPPRIEIHLHSVDHRNNVFPRDRMPHNDVGERRQKRMLELTGLERLLHVRAPLRQVRRPSFDWDVLVVSEVV
jgi:hypothetical protein